MTCRPERAVVMLGFGAALLALLVWAPWRSERSLGAYSADGYIAAVNEIVIPQRMILADLSGETPVLSVNPAARENADFARFLTTSYLEADLANPSLWVIRNGLVTRLDPNAHRIPLPSDIERIWRGDLQFADASSDRPTLAGSLGEFHLTASAFNEEGREIREEPAEVAMFGPRREVRANEVRLFEAPGVRDAVRIRLAGDAIIVRVADYAEASVFVGGRSVTPGTATLARRGDELLFIQGERRAMMMVGGSSSRALQLSEFRRWSEREHADVLGDFSTRFEQAMVRAMANGEASQASELADFDVTTSIEYGPQRETDSRLRTLLSGREFQGGRGYLGAVTIMNATEGEIIALASAERAPDSERLLEWNVEGRIDPNFRRLQIGSAAKPLIAALILEEHPELHTLRIARNTEIELTGLLGTPFDGPVLKVDEGGRGAVVDFNRFIERSDNAYAAALMLLSAPSVTRHRIAMSEPIEINGQVMTSRPPTAFEEVSNGRPRFAVLQGSSIPIHWDDRLRDAFDVDYDTRPVDDARSANNCRPGAGRLGDDTHDISAWAPLLDRFTWVTPCLFAAVAPERETFGFTEMHDFRTEVLPIILGGGNASWSNVKVAQSYARLVTGRRIEASLVRRPAAPNFRPISLSPFARNSVTYAMRLVVGGNGTAGRAEGANGSMNSLIENLLTDARRDGEVLGVFAKTGTPEIEFEAHYPSGRAINALINARRVQMSEGRLVYRVGGDGAVLAIVPENTRRLVEAIENDASAASLLSQARVGRRLIVSQLIADNADRETVAARYDIEGFVLVAKKPNRTRTGFGKVFAIVVARYPAGTPVDSRGLALSASVAPLAAYVVSVNIERGAVSDEEPPIERNWAAALSVDLVGDIVAPRLMRRVRERPRA